DVTIPTRSLVALRESNERFRLMLDEAPIGMALVALDGRFTRVNSVLCEILGYARQELTQLTFQEITHPADLAIDVSLSQQLVRGEIPRYQLENRYIHKNGSSVDALLSVSLLRESDGTPLYYIVQIEDVTERKLAEAALRRSEEQFRELIERLPDGVFVHRKGRLIYANEALARLLHYASARSLAGAPMSHFYHPEDIALVEGRAEDAEHGGAVTPQELRMVRSNCSICFVETTSIRIRFEEEPATVVVVRDLTDRKRVEQVREESLQKLRAVLDLAPVGIMLRSENGNWEGNKRANELHGRSIEGTIALDTYSDALLDPEAKPFAIRDLPGERAFQGERIERVEMRLRRPDGRLVPVLVNAAPLPAIGGAPSAVVTLEDISPFKELEQLRIEWSSLIAHDLRQPLSSISLCAQLVAEHATTAPAVKRRMQQIRDLSRRLSRMVQDLLDFSRLEAHKLTLDRQPIDLLETVRDAIEINKLEACGRPIELQVHGERARVSGDADRLAQVLDNLLSNAIKYGAPGTPIIVDMMTESNVVTVSVTNHGPGILPEQVPQLFARFQRARESKGEGVKGIGLGLYITKELVSAHGGRIWVESVPGDTTMFRFTLPLAGPC
ncbi:MAG TPA: PAS domain S-box protein, partial [Labilithrix sp.]|nr:PAS domain S-box protein [Labilithrix sp.]